MRYRKERIRRINAINWDKSQLKMMEDHLKKRKELGYDEAKPQLFLKPRNRLQSETAEDDQQTAEKPSF